ncbi:polysaccharide biosynthesis/export family protein [Thalassotalea atypica]|uniref:polysaccharide biosynthesis/export family protein n=1 Tax=Thalassotalea atypica TaxID=2054316 RepID=UPI0025744FF9|nr:polysaccharide biosynthesis/export family protein [Thalassotalea atypica]
MNSPVLAGDYLLGSGDKIKITVYNEPDLTVEAKIDRTGIVSFPFIKDIAIIGMTTEAVELQVRNGLLGDYLVDPQVSVSVIDYRPFFIHGEVVKPGGYPYQEDLRLDKAIALAGGLANRASKSNWKITRSENGKTFTIEADISTVVLPDDIIKIEQSFF